MGWHSHLLMVAVTPVDGMALSPLDGAVMAPVSDGRSWKFSNKWNVGTHRQAEGERGTCGKKENNDGNLPVRRRSVRCGTETRQGQRRVSTHRGKPTAVLECGKAKDNEKSVDF